MFQGSVAAEALRRFWRTANAALLFLCGMASVLAKDAEAAMPYQKHRLVEFMSSEIMHQIVATIEAETKSMPAAIEFEMAYQIRIAVERIRFAIKHMEQFVKPCDQARDAGLQLLDALDRLEAVDRRLQVRSRRSSENGNGHRS
jgi:hypothetical protein